MKSKIIKSTDRESDTIISLQQKIERLQIQVNGLKNKILRFENKSLKQERKIIKLQAENEKLKEENQPGSIIIRGIDDTHNKPPENNK